MIILLNIAQTLHARLELQSPTGQNSGMVEILSLSKARKAKARAAKDDAAAENRAKFGRTRAEKAKSAAENSMRVQHIDAHKRDT